MTDSLYLDGSVAFHRYPGSTTIHRGAPDERLGAMPVVVLDPDALAAHDQAVAATALQGEPSAPLYDERDWTWALLEPGEPGQPTTQLRVMAGWYVGDDTFHCYVSPERLVQQFREHVERWGS